jgi:hypothetical protein
LGWVVNEEKYFFLTFEYKNLALALAHRCCGERETHLFKDPGMKSTKDKWRTGLQLSFKP